MKTLKYLLSVALVAISTQIGAYIIQGETEKNFKYTLESVEGNKATVVRQEGLLGSKNASNVEKLEGYVIDTRNNKAGIEENDICAVVSEDAESATSGHVVVCKSGKVVKDICKETGSSTGTPPWLGEDKFIGLRNLNEEEGSRLMGAGRREVYTVCSVHAMGTLE